METSSHGARKVYLIYYSNNKGLTTTSSFSAIQWIDLGYDVIAHVEDSNGEAFETEPLCSLVLSTEGKIATTKSGARYSILRKNDKTRQIKNPSFIEETKAKDPKPIENLKEVKKMVDAGKKVVAFYHEHGSVKVTTAYLKSIDIEAKSFKTVTDISYFF